MARARIGRRLAVAGLAVTGLAALLSGASARAELIHRYSFDGAEVKDSVGKVNGTLKGDAKLADGKLVLENTDKMSGDAKLSYVQFNGPIAPKQGSVSIVAWVTAKQSPAFARVLDIGDVEGGEGRAFLYVMTRHEEDDKSRAAITASTVAERAFVTGEPLDDNKPHVAAVIVDGAAKTLGLYVDGKAAQPAEALGDNTLDKVRQTHAWLGRSGFDSDPGLTGSIDELRVYDHALTEAEAKAITDAGPDKLPEKPAPTTAPTTAPATGQ